MQQLNNILLLTLLIIIISGCDRPADRIGKTTYRTGSPPVTSVDDEDTTMNAAITKARATVADFIAALNHPKPTQTEFSVKLKIGEGETSEHMWLSPVRHEAGTFIGILGNEPLHPQSVKYGDELKVAENEISDWMFVEEGKLVGGYTLRVLRDKLSPNEQREFDSTVPFRIE